MKAELDWIEKAKKNAALEAVKHVKDGQIIGLGSGSTIAYAIEAIGERIKQEKICVLGVPTSTQASMLATRYQIPLTSLDEHPKLDLTIDGADQIDGKLDMIKGMGGALTREKIVALCSKQQIIVADERKKVKTLGQDNQPLPIEVMPFAIPLVTREIREIEGKPVLRESKGKVGPVVSDNGNYIVDVYFGPISDTEKLEKQLKSLTGVIETGLFIKMADAVYFGTATTVQKLRK